jgi:ABC-type multidrug transport system fused ATPase/permease subunit
MSTLRSDPGYLRPHAGLFGVAIAAMVVFAALDAFSFTLLIPFARRPLRRGAGMPLGGGCGEGSGAIHRLLDWTVGDLVRRRSPMVALRNVVLVLFGVFLVKNVALYVQQYTCR